ncbi:MAG: hypothetical protein Q9165_002165 [Trypethelium subeluteriae]
MALDNVDYDDIKGMIKKHTTPDSGGAVSIPGQSGGPEKSFEDVLYGILLEQHQLVDLFARSKTGEIQRRLGSLEKQTRQMNDRLRATRANKITVKRLERYARLENEILRYIGAQRLAFFKLLKKYKKWTHSEVLAQRFKSDLNKPGSFSTIDLTHLLAKWADALQDVRAPFEPEFYKQSADQDNVNLGVPGQSQPTNSAMQKLNESQVTNYRQPRLEIVSSTAIDTAFATAPRDMWRRPASYWVHYDNIVELQVLLLQHMRLLSPSNSNTPISQSPSTQFRGKSATASQTPSPIDSENDLNTIIIEDPHYLSEEQNSRCSSMNAPPLVRLSVRYSSSSEAIVSLQPNPDCTLDSIVSSKLKVKHLAPFLDTQAPFRRSSSTPGTPILETAVFDFAPTDAIRDWLRDNSHVEPLVGICSKRTHFTGLERDSTQSIWAVLDKNISFSRMKSEDLSNCSGMPNLRLNSRPFPHAVLHVRQMSEGANAIIHKLEQSHLVERIPGFSIEAHAVWECCRPQNMQPPHWIPRLSQDIRKVPVSNDDSQRTSHSSPNATGFDQKEDTSSRLASASEPFEGSDTAVSLPKPGSYRTTSDLKAANVNNPRRKRRRAYAEARSLARNRSEQRYWNEYDDPEDGNDDAYVIWVDPNSGTSFKQWFGKLLPTWHHSRSAANTRVLLPHDNTSSTEDGLLDDSSSSSSSPPVQTTPRKPWTYGTFNPFKSRGRPHPSPPSRSRTYSNRMHTHPNIHNPTTALLPTLASDSASTAAARYERIRSTLTVLTFSAATAILAVIGVLAATGRHKQAYEVDAGILFGIVVNLVFACVGLGCLVSGRGTSWVGWCGGLVLFAVICVGNGGLCAWLVS